MSNRRPNTKRQGTRELQTKKTAPASALHAMHAIALAWELDEKRWPFAQVRTRRTPTGTTGCADVSIHFLKGGPKNNGRFIVFVDGKAVHGANHMPMTWGARERLFNRLNRGDHVGRKIGRNLIRGTKLFAHWSQPIPIEHYMAEAMRAEFIKRLDENAANVR